MQNMNGASSLCSGTNPNSGSSSIGSSVGSHSSNTNNNHSPKFAGIAVGGGLAHGIYGEFKKKKKKEWLNFRTLWHMHFNYCIFVAVAESSLDDLSQDSSMHCMQHAET